MALDHVDYNALDSAKNAFINACKKTLHFAENFGFVPNNQLGASANVFALDLNKWNTGKHPLYLTLLPEGLGTADDAKPKDLNPDEEKRFWYNIGIKTLSVMTNDAASSGMQTVLLSLYLPCAQPELVFSPLFLEGFLNGIVDGCKQVGCIYFSGETPQLKTKIQEGRLDIAGAVFGILPPGIDPVDGTELGPNQYIVFIASNGPNENGFTSLRDLATRLPQGYRTKLPSGKEYWQAINNPSHLYTPLIQDLLLNNIRPTNIEPITGHGWQKIMRNKKPLKYEISTCFDLPEIFQFVEENANIKRKELVTIFNCGVGLCLYAKTKEDAQKMVDKAKNYNLDALIAGQTKPSDHREVVIKPWDIILSEDSFLLEQG